MRLDELIDRGQVLAPHGPLPIDVARVVPDSREVVRGDLFVCLPGYRTEGGETRADRHDFIPAALQQGAAALLVERDVGPLAAIPVGRVRDAGPAAATAAARYYGHPARAL